MELPLLLFLIGIGCCALELFVMTFHFFSFGIALLITALAALYTENNSVLIVLFILLSCLILFLVLRLKKTKFLTPPQDFKDGFTGRTATLTHSFSSPEHPGRVKMYGDEFEIYWDDSSLENQDFVRHLVVGDRVKIARVIGNRVVITHLS